MKGRWHNTHKIFAQGDTGQNRIAQGSPRQTRIARGKPGLPRNTQFAKNKHLNELSNGQQFILTKGMTYVVSDELSSHRSTTVDVVKLLIIDGDFLKFSKSSD